MATETTTGGLRCGNCGRAVNVLTQVPGLPGWCDDCLIATSVPLYPPSLLPMPQLPTNDLAWPRLQPDDRLRRIEDRLDMLAAQLQRILDALVGGKA